MKTFHNKKGKIILSSLLYHLDVKYTNRYADKLYNEHPHKYNLFGISKMLFNYSIKNTAIKIANKKEKLNELEAPFIAHMGSIFVVVYKITIDKVFYTWNQRNLSISLNSFCETWSGIILYPDSDENSIEPNYQTNRKTQVLQYGQKVVFGLAILMVLTTSFIYNGLYNNIEAYLLTTVNLIGIYICSLLVLKQLGIHGGYADRVCSLFSKSDCNDVLESNAAKLGGVIGWSEIGLGYFTANILIVICFPKLWLYMTLVNLFVLPYSFWSIWYQKFNVRQWCPLCLVVQGLLGVTFIIHLGFGSIHFATINIIEALLSLPLYLIPISLIALLIPSMGRNLNAEQIIQELNSLKSDEIIFQAVLKKQPFYQVDKNTSSILWGNIESDMLVTILTNPHCAPCSRMHERVEKLLTESKNICVQYIFSSFENDLDVSNKFLSAIYFNRTGSERSRIFQEWFKDGKNRKEKFFEINNADIEDQQVTMEFDRHSTWKQKAGLNTTPTILINGYKLPDNYKIEDLIYI